MNEQKTEIRRTKIWDILIFIYIAGIITGIFITLWIIDKLKAV